MYILHAFRFQSSRILQYTLTFTVLSPVLKSMTLSAIFSVTLLSSTLTHLRVYITNCVILLNSYAQSEIHTTHKNRLPLAPTLCCISVAATICHTIVPELPESSDVLSL